MFLEAINSLSLHVMQVVTEALGREGQVLAVGIWISVHI